MKVSPDQLAMIRLMVNENNVTLPALRDDLIDHLCCVVEIEMKNGKGFDASLNEAIKDIAPDGLEEIQNETLYLLNSKKIIRMKQITYFIGFIGAFALTAATTFKLLHLPGADQLFIVGYIAFLFIFVPLLAADRFKVEMSKALSEKFKIIMGTVSAIVFGLAGLFKTLHIIGADILLVSGAFLFAAGFLPFYFFTMYKKSVA